METFTKEELQKRLENLIIHRGALIDDRTVAQIVADNNTARLDKRIIETEKEIEEVQNLLNQSN